MRSSPVGMEKPAFQPRRGVKRVHPNCRRNLLATVVSLGPAVCGAAVDVTHAVVGLGDLAGNLFQDTV